MPLIDTEDPEFFKDLDYAVGHILTVAQRIVRLLAANDIPSSRETSGALSLVAAMAFLETKGKYSGDATQEAFLEGTVGVWKYAVNLKEQRDLKRARKDAN